MDNIVGEKLLYAFDKYFINLSQFGQSKKIDDNSLLVLMLINNLLNGPTKSFITESDYKIMDLALNCLYGKSCLIPFSEYCENQCVF